MPLSDTRYDVHVAEEPLSMAYSYWSDYLATLAPITTDSTSYYRSQLYTEKTGINPLVTAAAPLLNLLSKINTHQLQITSEFSHILEHEFKAFITFGSQQNYDSEILQMAYHMLHAAFLEAEQQTGDEVIEVSPSDSKKKLDFFTLIEQLQDTMPLDLLELGYLILSLGYTGKYRSIPDGKTKLELLRKQLYQQIRKQRGDFSRTLGIDEQPVDLTTGTKQTHAAIFNSIIVATLSILLMLGISLNYVLSLAATPTFQEVQQIQQTLAGSDEPISPSLIS